MPALHQTVERILQLSAFDGDSALALRTLHAHFAERFPGCALALVLIGGLAPGQCRLAGLIGADGVEHVPNVDPLGERSTLPLFDDALTAKLFIDTAPHLISVAPTDFALPFAQALLAPASLLGIPVVNAGVINHWLIFGSSLHGRFDRVDLDELLLEVNLAANLIVRPLATRALRDESKRHRQVIEGIADVQRLLLPDGPVIRGLEYAVHWQPAETAAGDYYDLMSLTQYAPADFPRDGADIWALMLADVSGHGAAAAMEAVQFDAILRTYQGDEESGPAGALTYANRYFFSRRQRQHFLTAFALLYRPDLGRATYVDAGHPPLLHRRGNTVTLRGAGTQIPLGILRDHVWQNETFDVESGDVLVLYTDGVVEARDRTHRPFGSERLSALVASGPSDPPALLALVRDEVIAHQGSPLGVDDQTLIVLRITD
ncbi:PP2C family protein-serine/threonine phosphatase [Dokdonella soli]|uniref:PP2C family protein-serine/threonine phosphatase n=1 Tax=Dokdonella soli TaxID=529810 RepID=UPI0031DEBD1A